MSGSTEKVKRKSREIISRDADLELLGCASMKSESAFLAKNLYHLNLSIRGASGRSDDRFERLKPVRTRSDAELAE
jgi:hypothetical protein